MTAVLWRLEQGDCRKVMRKLAADGFVADAIVTDPPYELSNKRETGGIAGHQWDSRGVSFDADTWRAAHDLLPPGGHLAAFSGSRTYHRMAVAIEDAGFEIRDQIMWLYGTGFPKSHDVAKAIDAVGGRDGLATRREIAEAIEASGLSDAAIGRSVGRTGNMVKAWRLGTRNISIADAAKLSEVIGSPVFDHEDRPVVGRGKSGMGRPGAVLHSANGASRAFRHRDEYDLTKPASADAREWEGWGTALRPAHELIVLARKPLDGSVAGNVLEHGAGALNVNECRAGDGRWPPNVAHDGSDEVEEAFGTASRFFYCAKASKKERQGSEHPTVKPIALMRWLVRMVTPPGGTVLDPFAGTGTTGQAAVEEGFKAVLIEQDEGYVADIVSRMDGDEGSKSPRKRAM